MGKIMSGFAGLLILAVLCQAVGAAGAYFTVPSIPGWYAEIAKPSFTPPGWIFGPAWTLLYALMAIACWWVLRAPAPKEIKRPALILFSAQLLANAAWSPIFFGLRRPDLAFIDILLLWGLIVLTVCSFFRISRAAGFLLLPYLLWVTFAAVLNGFIWKMNS